MTATGGAIHRFIHPDYRAPATDDPKALIPEARARQRKRRRRAAIATAILVGLGAAMFAFFGTTTPHSPTASSIALHAVGSISPSGGQVTVSSFIEIGGPNSIPWAGDCPQTIHATGSAGNGVTSVALQTSSGALIAQTAVIHNAWALRSTTAAPQAFRALVGTDSNGKIVWSKPAYSCTIVGPVGRKLVITTPELEVLTARYLGLSRAQLLADMRVDTVGHVAAAHGKNPTSLIDYLIRRAKARLSEAVKAGRITAAQKPVILRHDGLPIVRFVLPTPRPGTYHPTGSGGSRDGLPSM